MGKQWILIAEDDEDIREGLKYALEQEGYGVISCGSVAEAGKVLERESPDLCLLDVAFPDGTGYELCRAARENKNRLPVIFLTACDAEVSVVMGLDMGADDYITKPFRIRELISRIRSVLRRCGSEERPGAGAAQIARSSRENSVIEFGNVRIYLEEARVFRLDGQRNASPDQDRDGRGFGAGKDGAVPEAGREVQLTALEYRLLLTFAKHKGQVLSRGQLLSGIWDAAGDFVNDNTVSVYIKRLREKLEEDPAKPRLIQTVRGFGYRAGDV